MGRDFGGDIAPALFYPHEASVFYSVSGTCYGRENTGADEKRYV